MHDGTFLKGIRASCDYNYGTVDGTYILQVWKDDVQVTRFISMYSFLSKEAQDIFLEQMIKELEDKYTKIHRIKVLYLKIKSRMNNGRL